MFSTLSCVTIGVLSRKPAKSRAALVSSSRAAVVVVLVVH